MPSRYGIEYSLRFQIDIQRVVNQFRARTDAVELCAALPMELNGALIGDLHVLGVEGRQHHHEGQRKLGNRCGQRQNDGAPFI